MKPSLNPDKAKQGGGGVEPGIYEVTGAKFQNLKIFDRPNQLNLVLEAAVCNKDGERVRGADPAEIQFSFGQKSLEAFHPAKAKSQEDPDPEDLGDGVDVEGNSIYCSQDAQFNKSCGAIVFNESLVKNGFPKTALDLCWAPIYIGLKFELAVLKSIEVNNKYGTRLNTKPMADGGEVTYKVAVRWLNPNYLSVGASKPNGVAAAGTTEAASSGSGEAAETKLTDPEEIATFVLGKVAALKAGPSKAIKTKQALTGFFTNEYTKSKQDPKKLSACQELVKNEEWVTNAVAELGGSYVDGRVEFPELSA